MVHAQFVSGEGSREKKREKNSCSHGLKKKRGAGKRRPLDTTPQIIGDED